MRLRTKRSKSIINADESIPSYKMESILGYKYENLSGISMLSSDLVDISDSEKLNGQISAAYDYDVSPALPTIRYGKLVIINEISILEKLNEEIEGSDMNNKPLNLDYRIKVTG